MAWEGERPLPSGPSLRVILRAPQISRTRAAQRTQVAKDLTWRIPAPGREGGPRRGLRSFRDASPGATLAGHSDPCPTAPVLDGWASQRRAGHRATDEGRHRPSRKPVTEEGRDPRRVTRLQPADAPGDTAASLPPLACSGARTSVPHAWVCLRPGFWAAPVTVVTARARQGSGHLGPGHPLPVLEVAAP